MLKHERVYQLWDELAVYPQTETPAACMHLMRTVSGWLGANRAGWVGTVRFLSGSAAQKDVLSGWRQRSVQFLHPFTAAEKKLAKKVLTTDMDWGMATAALAKTSGVFRYHRMRDGFMDYAAFRETEHYRHFYTDFGVYDRIWVGFPASTEAESFFVFDHRYADKRFSLADLNLAAYALRGLKWFHRRLLMEHGLLLVQKPLTPQERVILRHLLSGLSIKQIADRVNLSPHTTNDHIKQIYRKYSVNSRTELMAIWFQAC